MCHYVIVCVVFIVLLVAVDALAVVGDASFEKSASVISKKKVPRENLSPLRFIY